MNNLKTTIALALSSLVFLSPAWCQEPQPISTFMRAKLTHSQKILEGLATEDFEMIIKAAEEMRLLSLASQWQVLQTAEYARRSGEFRRAANEIKKAAEKKNLDGATLAFVGVTMTCVECHKYIRSVSNARLDFPPRKKPFERTPSEIGPKTPPFQYVNAVAGKSKDEFRRFNDGANDGQW